MQKLSVIAFDADDTLWVNEPIFQRTEREFCKMMSAFGTNEEIAKELFQTEMQNMEIYGYGVKAFILSIIETGIRVSKQRIPADKIQAIVTLGKEMLYHPVDLLDGVRETLSHFAKLDYQLIVATKGDLLDQKRKLKDSKLGPYFHHVEIMPDKTQKDYLDLFNRLRINPDEFMMIGNSYKSDCKPVLELGGYAIHVPYHTTWLHEKNVEVEQHKNLHIVDSIKTVTTLIGNYSSPSSLSSQNP